MITIAENDIATLWLRTLSALIKQGGVTAPRGQKIYELCDVKLVLLDAKNNLLKHPVRKLSPRFAVAEWLWIWFGHQDVKTIAQYSSRIAQFSDDGEKFNGTYGVPIIAQWEHTRQLLEKDADTRQAVISIYRFTDIARWEREHVYQKWESKDIPCTLTLQFLMRDGRLNMIANMRSSDIWLGIPYDVFNFTMLLNVMAAQLRAPIGQLSLNLGSSHLYDRNLLGAKEVLNQQDDASFIAAPNLPSEPPTWLDEVLTSRRGIKHTDRDVWSRYNDVLVAMSEKEAYSCLAG